jgi:hypothetical protein
MSLWDSRRYEGSRDIAVVWQRRQKPNGMVVGDRWLVWLGETLDSEHESEFAAIRRARTMSGTSRRAVWILRDGITPELMPRSL